MVGFANVTSRKPLPAHAILVAMWIGIIVLCTFGAAALVSAAFAIRCAFTGQWHMTFGLSIPAIFIGGALAVLVGPTLWLEIAGNPDLQELPDEARMLSDSELTDLYADATHEGRYYEDGKWQVFSETYDATGGVIGAGGPPDDPERHKWRGAWKVEDGKVCFDYDQGFECEPIYRVGDGYVGINHRDEINESFQVVAPGATEQAEAG